MHNRLILLLIATLLFSTGAYAQNAARFSDLKAGMTDRGLELQAIREANKRGIAFCWREDYSKAIIISPKWEMDLDANGYLRARKIHVQLYGTLSNGRCAVTDFTFKQKLLRNEKFSTKLYYESVGDMVYVECE